MAKHESLTALLIILEVTFNCLMALPNSLNAAQNSSNMSTRVDLIEENGEKVPVQWVKRLKRASQTAHGIFRGTKRGTDETFRKFFTDLAKLKQGVTGVTLWDDKLIRVI